MVPPTDRTRPSLIVLLAQVVTAFVLVSWPVAAQQKLDLAASLREKPASETDISHSTVEPVASSGVSNDRLFYALPNFLTVDSSQTLPPLTAPQKFKVVARSSFDYVEYPWYAFRAGISQAQNSEPAYGQGAAGYAKRYALTFADCTTENFMVGAVLPSLLRQDPRYYRAGQGTVRHRMGYAVSRIFVTRADSGREQFNFSEILGSALAAGISTYSYHPAQDRTLGNVACGWGTQLAFHTFTIVMREFWPDLRRKISQKPHRDDSAL